MKIAVFVPILCLFLIFCPILLFAQQKSPKLTQLLSNPEIRWKEYHSNNFRYFVEEGGYADNRIDSIKSQVEKDRVELLPFFYLGDSLAVKTDIVIYHSEEQVKQVMGFVVQGFALSEHKALIFLHNSRYRLASRHELAHYYAFHLWGREADNGFSEGIAVCIDKSWSGHPINQLSKHLKNERRLIKMPELLKNFFKFDPMIAYPQIGSFTDFLLSYYGKEKLYQVWQSGFSKSKRIYGVDLAGLEKQWLSWLDQWDANHIDYSQHLKSANQ